MSVNVHSWNGYGIDVAFRTEYCSGKEVEVLIQRETGIVDGSSSSAIRVYMVNSNRKRSDQKATSYPLENQCVNHDEFVLKRRKRDQIKCSGTDISYSL